MQEEREEIEKRDREINGGIEKLREASKRKENK